MLKKTVTDGVSLAHEFSPGKLTETFYTALGFYDPDAYKTELDHGVVAFVV